MMIGTVPPSALQAAPVTYDARSEARKAITAAISSGSARRPNGRPLPTASSTSSWTYRRGPPAGRQGHPRRAMHRRRRSGRDRVAADPIPGIEIRHEPGGQRGRLRDRIVRHRGRGPLPGSRRNVHHYAATPLAHPRQDRANRPDEAHHVQLPHLVPLLVGDLVERKLIRDADVVHEHVDRPELGLGLADQHGGRIRFGEIAGHTERSAELLSGLFDALGLRPVTTTSAPSSTRSFAVSRPIPCRPGDDADAVAQAGVHGRLAYRRDDDHLLARHGESDWNRSKRWQGFADRPLTDLDGSSGGAGAAPRGHRARRGVLERPAAARDTAEVVAQSSGLRSRRRPTSERSTSARGRPHCAEAEARYLEPMSAGFRVRAGKTVRPTNSSASASSRRSSGSQRTTEESESSVVAHGEPSERSMPPRSVSTSTRTAGSSASSRTRRSRQSASTKAD